MSAAITLQLTDERLERLRRLARALNRPVDEVAGNLIEEGLRQREFPGIEFRDSGLGRQAYVRATRLAVWMVGLATRSHPSDPDITRADLSLSTAEWAAALAYRDAYPDEIAAAIAANDAAGDRLAASLPPDQVLDM